MRLRKPLRDVVAENQRALDQLAALSGRPRIVLRPEAPKREYTNRRTDGGEAAVIKAISEYLAINRYVQLALRVNSGSAQAIGRDGKPFPIWFHRFLRNPRDVAVSDFVGFLMNGQGFAIEAKAPRWGGPKTEREARQHNFIVMVREIGGRAGFATSVEEAKSIMEE